MNLRADKLASVLLCSFCFQLRLNLCHTSGFPQRQSHWHSRQRSALSFIADVKGGTPSSVHTSSTCRSLRLEGQTCVLLRPDALAAEHAAESLLPLWAILKMSSLRLTRKM